MFFINDPFLFDFQNRKYHSLVLTERSILQCSKHLISLIHSYKLPTPAEKIASVFVDKICDLLPDFIEGAYLIGSLPLNDFRPTKSDIDFLVLCKVLPDEKMALQLKQIHTSIARQYPKIALSGCYLTIENIQSEHPENTRVLSYHEKLMKYQNFEMAPVSLTELKENAYTLFGIQASTLPVNINHQKLNDFLFKNINSYWANWIKQHNSILNRKILLLAFPRLTEWVILGLARQLYTLQTGKITSKTAAGYYCLECLPEKFHPVVKEAIETRLNERTYPFLKSYTIKPSLKRFRQSIECAHYIIGSFNKMCSEKGVKTAFSN